MSQNNKSNIYGFVPLFFSVVFIFVSEISFLINKGVKNISIDCLLLSYSFVLIYLIVLIAYIVSMIIYRNDSNIMEKRKKTIQVFYLMSYGILSVLYICQGKVFLHPALIDIIVKYNFNIRVISVIFAIIFIVSLVFEYLLRIPLVNYLWNSWCIFVYIAVLGFSLMNKSPFYSVLEMNSALLFHIAYFIIAQRQNIFIENFIINDKNSNTKFNILTLNEDYD